MHTILYTLLLLKYGVTYLGLVSKSKNGTIIYGYNKKSKQYYFWKVKIRYELELISVCDSKTATLFCYRILCRGV